jgi:hypothetical protein
MSESDMLAYTIAKFGAPEQAQPVVREEAERYAGRVPDALIRFWLQHGRGAFQGGKFRICDPAPLQPVIEALFHGDPDFNPAEMTAVGYSAFGRLEIWHRTRRSLSADFLFLNVFNPPQSAWHDRQTGRPFSADYSIANQLTSFQFSPVQVDSAGNDLLPQAIARLGALECGEIYAFMPAISMGGAYSVDNLRRVDATAYMLVMAEMSNFTLTRLTKPEPPAHPYGRVEAVRGIGVSQ